jgi:hypothetical protein
VRQVAETTSVAPRHAAADCASGWMRARGTCGAANRTTWSIGSRKIGAAAGAWGGSIDGLAMSGGAHSLERNWKYASGVVCSCEHQLTRRRSIVGLPTNVWSARSWLRLPRRRLAICSGPPFGAASRTAAMKTAFVIADLLKRSLCARCASNFCAHARVLLAPGGVTNLARDSWS